jgi:hypothetical protein
MKVNTVNNMCDRTIKIKKSALLNVNSGTNTTEYTIKNLKFNKKRKTSIILDNKFLNKHVTK